MTPKTLSTIKLYPDPSRVIMDFMEFPLSRFENVLQRVKNIDEEKAALELEKAIALFSDRHRDLGAILEVHFERILEIIPAASELSPIKQRLLSSIFTMEYSIEGAALFNPSIVAHPDQSGLSVGETRFIMSVRAVGEGHMSSIGFRTGILDKQGNIQLEEVSKWSTKLEKVKDKVFHLFDVINQITADNDIAVEMWKQLPSKLNLSTLEQLHANPDNSIDASLLEQLSNYMKINYDLKSPKEMPDSEKVIWPQSPAESRGMEDLRLVKCEDGVYRGTYTAYNGRKIGTQMLETRDFSSFAIRSLHGSAISDKGMALFPEKINGKFAMIGRQDGESLTIMYSNDRYTWNSHLPLINAGSCGDYLQTGNCGSPIRTSKGWLLLTHGVGPFRQYWISALLLDLNDPSKIIGQRFEPMLKPEENNREGYVPNVVYCCGMMQSGARIIIPYAYCDSYITFATFNIKDLLSAMR